MLARRRCAVYMKVACGARAPRAYVHESAKERACSFFTGNMSILPAGAPGMGSAGACYHMLSRPRRDGGEVAPQRGKWVGAGRGAGANTVEQKKALPGPGGGTARGPVMQVFRCWQGNHVGVWGISNPAMKQEGTNA